LAGFGIGALGGGIFDLIAQYIELQDEGIPFWENVNWERTLKRAGAVGLIGAVGGYLYYRLKLSQEAELPFNSDTYLHQVITENNIRADRSLYETAVKKRDEIKSFLAAKFNGQLAGAPVNWGSTARGTAIGDNFDFDILIPFSAYSFGSLEDMYNAVYKALYDKFDTASSEVRKQKRSLGMTFYLNDSELHFDIVPGREINNYQIDKELNLYVRPDNFWSQSSRIKTNLDAHRNMTVNRPDERKAVKLLKLYRDKNRLNMKSAIIQNMVMKAFDRKAPSFSLSENLFHSMEYIANNLSISRVIDPGNTGNSLSESMDSYERNSVINRLNQDLDKIANNDRYFKEIFQ
jgi:hypothetical protein